MRACLRHFLALAALLPTLLAGAVCAQNGESMEASTAQSGGTSEVRTQFRVLALYHESAVEYAKGAAPHTLNIHAHLIEVHQVLSNSDLQHFSFSVVDPDDTWIRDANKALAEKPASIRLGRYDTVNAYIEIHDENGQTTDAGKTVRQVFRDVQTNLSSYDIIRQKSGADICVIFVHDKNLKQGIGKEGINTGASKTPDLYAPDGTPRFTTRQHFIVVEIGSLGQYTLIHELGHLMGCGHADPGGHDNCNVKDPGAPPACGLHGFSGQHAPYRTIMAYDKCGDVKFPLSANPAFSQMNGTDTHIHTGETVSLGDYKHDNAGVFRNNATLFACESSWAGLEGNDDFAKAELIDGKHQDHYVEAPNLGYCVKGDTLLGSHQNGDPIVLFKNKNTTGTSGHTLWYRYKAPQDGMVQCGINSHYPSIAFLLAADVPEDGESLDSIKQQAQSICYREDHPNKSNWFTVQGGQTVYFCVDAIRQGCADNTGKFQLYVLFRPASAEPGMPVRNIILLILTISTFAAAVILIIRSLITTPKPAIDSEHRLRHIVIIHPDGKRESYPFLMDSVTIGRNPDNDVVLRDPSVSGRHAMLRVRDGELEIKDLGSSNGTLILKDGIILHRNEAVKIETEETIALGRVHITVEYF